MNADDIDHSRPNRANPGGVDPGRMDPGRMDPGRMDPGRMDPGRMVPGRMDRGVAHFVHDFAGIDLPLSSVVCAIDVIATPSLFQEFVASAWVHEIGALDATACRAPIRTRPHVDVVFGEQRARSDAVILPIAWHARSGAWIPPLDADLEFAAFGPERTHVHLYGCSELPPGALPATGAASMAQRLTVAVVRHVLTLLSQRVVDVTLDGAATSPRSM